MFLFAAHKKKESSRLLLYFRTLFFSPGRGAFFFIAILSLLAYLQSLDNELVMDDRGILMGNTLIHDLKNLAEIIGSNYWGEVKLTGEYRPLVIASFALEYALWGENPLGYHVVNVLLHGCNSLLVLWLGLYLLRSRSMGTGAALLFALHPIHTEAVNPVVGRCDLLSTLFFLLSLLLFLQWRRGEGRGERERLCLFAAWFSYFLALLAKESAILLPLILFLLEIFRKGEEKGSLRIPSLAPYIGFLGAGACYFSLRFYSLGFLWHPPSIPILPLDNPLVEASWIPRIFTALTILGRYLLLLLFPIALSADYSPNAIPLVDAPSDSRFLLCTGTLFLAILFAFLFIRKSPLVSFSLFFLLTAFLPVSNLFLLIGTLMGERTSYLPSVGFCLLMAFFVLGKIPGAWRKGAVILPILLLFGVRTVERNRFWQDEGTLFENMVRTAPESSRAHRNYGYFLAQREDRLEQAIREFKKALAIRRDYGDARLNLGICLMKKGDLHRAEEEFLHLVENPDAGWEYSRAEGHFFLGEIYQRSKSYEKACEAYRAALELTEKKGTPLVKAYLRLGDLYFEQYGMLDQAEHYYEKYEKSGGKSERARKRRGFIHSQKAKGLPGSQGKEESGRSKR